jgi:probable addiction module antidote protein
MKTDYAPLDVSSYLTDEETIAEYLTAAAEDENPDVLLRALAEVAKARGMAQVARDAGLGRESLYKALAPGSHPRFETITAVLRALGVRIVAQAPKKKVGTARVKTIDPNIGVAVAGLRASKRSGPRRKTRAHA